MLDSRLSNAHSDIRADLHGLSTIASQLEELLGELRPSWERTAVTRAANHLGAAIASLAHTVEAIGDAVGRCPHPLGMTPCSGIHGHTGPHHAGDRTWDDAQSAQARAAVVAAMGNRCE